MEKNDLHSIPVFGYELIRDHVLSSILGKHEESILYWAGKELARKFPLNTIEEAAAFFEQAGWGDLHLVKEGKDMRLYELHLKDPSLSFDNRCFKLEAGYLAAQHERACGFLTECFEEKNTKRKTVSFKLKSDLKEPIQPTV